MKEYNAEEMAQQIMNLIQKEYKDLKKLNIMVLGKTGVGKSTLINNLFSEKIVDTGIGKPVTPQIRKIEKEGYPLALYDTPGLELNGENAIDNLLAQVKEEMKKGMVTGDVGNAIHCICYCVAVPSHRFEQAEVDFLKKFLVEAKEYHVPVIVVLTQAYNKKETKTLMNVIEKENLEIVKIVPILAEDYEMDDEYIAKSYGLDKLADVMLQTIPEAVKKTFVAIQCVNLNIKIERAQKIVGMAATAAMATGATPIPFSDAALLVPEEIAMLGKITTTFGLPIAKGTIMTIISSTIGTTGATILGKSVVSGLLKFVPGVGSVVGGVISGAAAAALTAALGEAYIAILVQICKGNISMSELESEKGKKQVQDIFRERLKMKRKKNGQLK